MRRLGLEFSGGKFRFRQLKIGPVRLSVWPVPAPLQGALLLVGYPVVFDHSPSQASANDLRPTGYLPLTPSGWLAGFEYGIRDSGFGMADTVFVWCAVREQEKIASSG